ncbi:hypothetical protein BY996DRAFT_4575747 [Phakopsora pachyrhizi]|uniref:PCI domain-containing protein n=1 Tax=Phakopsora pachyrhizi TaxID=170000 RepID=A0AAV0BI91_PHAPC|nr:hypothetical protein BY996DRAFT_4575747 [Phakopsora pachyrhizi]CAH7686616.1 hypothetical protein PPACK8108_LOCUS21293 [Phakopsora pachyrhizi]
MSESPFLASANTNTTKQGSIWTVLVQPLFEDLVFEASVLITKGAAIQAALAAGAPKNFNQPSEFAIRIRDTALELYGIGQEREEIDEADQMTKAETLESTDQDTSEIREKKRLIVEEIWSKLQPGVLTKTDDRELEAVTNLLLTLLSSFFLSNHPKFYGFASQVMDVIVTAEGKTTSYGRYSSLFTLFNSLPTPTVISDNQPPLQLVIFSRLVDMTSTHLEDLSILLPSLLKLPAYLTQWKMLSSRIGVSVIEKVLRLCEKAGKSADAFNLSVAYLSSPELAQVDLTSGIDQIAEIFIKLALELPEFYDWDLLGNISPAARYLSSNPDGQTRYSNLIKLLKSSAINIGQIEQELRSNVHLSKVISEDTKSKILKKARMLSLTELCGSRLGGQVKYSELKETLGLTTPIEEDDGMEVEEWIINAIKAKLITAKLHQPSQVVFVTKVTHRSFGPAQWQLLQSRLESWGSSIKQLTQVVDESLSFTEKTRQESGNEGSSNNNKGPNKLVSAIA